MAANKSKSLLMAQRLKYLRTQKGLSHESLRKALMEKYDIDISVDSLKNYEVSKIPHAKAYKNDGMRVEYLRCLSDFYGVSSDFLLGITDIESSEKGVQSIVRNTGLSEQSAVVLRALSMASSDTDAGASAIKRVLPVPKHFGEGDYTYLAVIAKSFVDEMIGALTEDEVVLRRYGTLMTTLLVKSQQDPYKEASETTSSNPFFSDGNIAVPMNDYVDFLIHEISVGISKYLSKMSRRNFELAGMEYGSD